MSKTKLKTTEKLEPLTQFLLSIHSPSISLLSIVYEVIGQVCKYQKNQCYSAKPGTTPLAGFPRREHTCTLQSVTPQTDLLYGTI